MGVEDLAQDVSWDILARLDFTTIICCKRVCKKWRDLVLDPYFVNNLLWSKKYNKNPSLMIHERGRLKWIEIQDKVVEVKKEQLVDVITIHDVGLSHPGVLGQFPGFDFRVIIGPSVNGLIYVLDAYRNTYIVNPIAKQYLTLPKSTINRSLGYGFGSSDDTSYKVINICERYEIIQIEVFTLGTDNRRVLPPNDHFKNIRGNMRDGLFFNGRVHWINHGGHCLSKNYGVYQLFDFELENETFNLFPSPPPFEGEEEQQDCRGILGVLKGCLSLCWYSSPSKISTVWAMKQHGITDSWYKAFTIKDTRIARKLSYPLCLLDGLKGGTLIANGGNKLVAYCLQTNTLRTINLTSSRATSNSRYRPVRTVHIKSVTPYHPTFLNLQNFASPNTLVQTF